MKLEQTIRRILREERNLSSRIRRRIPIELLEEKFLEAFNFALKLVKKLKQKFNYWSLLIEFGS